MPWTYMSNGLHVPQTMHIYSENHTAVLPWQASLGRGCIGSTSRVHLWHCSLTYLLVPKLHFSLPLRRLLEESTGLLEEEGGSQRCSARKLAKVRQSAVVDWPP